MNGRLIGAFRVRNYLVCKGLEKGSEVEIEFPLAERTMRFTAGKHPTTAPSETTPLWRSRPSRSNPRTRYTWTEGSRSTVPRRERFPGSSRTGTCPGSLGAPREQTPAPAGAISRVNAR